MTLKSTQNIKDLMKLKGNISDSIGLRKIIKTLQK